MFRKGLGHIVADMLLQLEVAFDDMAELELFWGNIPPAQHRAWSQRAQHVIVDGSPTWHVFRSVPALPPQQDAETTQAAASPSQVAGAWSRDEINVHGLLNV